MTPARRVYLDHNATTPPAPEVIEAMAAAMRDGWANPASVHALGRAARRIVDDAREAIAALAGESPRDVVLTSGGTEANNLAVLRPFAGPKGLVVTSALEHPSVLGAVEVARERGVRVAMVQPEPSGHISLASIEAALADRRVDEPSLVVLHAVHHETGAIQPVAGAVALCRRLGASLHVDAVQAAGRVAPELWRGADTVALASHKLRGPKGIGAVVSRAGVVIRPVLRGGSQERGLRPGTVDAVAAAGFGAAARRALAGGSERYAGLAPLRDRAERALLSCSAMHNITARPTASEPRAPHVTHLIVEAIRGDELAAALDLEGVCVSAGSACAAGTAEPSPAVVALVGRERARFSLRVSLGETTTPDDIEALEGAFARVLARAARQPRR